MAKTFRINNIWNFPTFNLYTVPAKIQYLQRYSTDFRNLCLSSKILREGVWVLSFSRANILLLEWHGENFPHQQHLKFCHFQPVHCASKNPISPKIFNRFSKSLPQLKDIEGGRLGVKFQPRKYFTFGMAWRKLSASTTFEILPFSTCTLCQQKSNISKDIQPIFEIFASAQRFWGRAFGWKASYAQVFYICNDRVKTLRIDNIWNFASFNLYTVPAKILYLQWYSTDFRNVCLCSKVLRECIWEKSFRCPNILLLQWHGEYLEHRQYLKIFHFQIVPCASKSLPQLEDFEGGRLGVKFQLRKYFTFGMAWRKLSASTTFEILPLSTCTLCQQKSNISKDIQPIFEIFASAQRYWGRAFVWKVYFCNDRVKTLRIETFGILLLSTCTLCQQKSYISNGIQPIFEIFASARRCWGSAFGCKVSGAQVFYFCNGRVKTLRINNIWNFATLNLYTVPAKILYLQRHSTDFRNLCLSSNILRQGIWVESCIWAGILIFQWQRENFAHRQLWNFATFNLYTVPAKIQYLQRYSTDFRNLCLSSKILREGVCVESLLLQWQGENFAYRNIWNFATFNLYTVPAKILYLQRYSTDFRNLCLSSKIARECICVESFICAGILILQWQRENFAHRRHLKFCYFQPAHCTRKNPISPKVFNRFSKSLPQLKDIEGGHLGGKFHMRRYFTFAMAGWKLCASTTFEILLLSTCTLCQQKSYISNGFNRFSKSWPLLEYVEGVHLGEKFQVCKYFTFAMARWKICESPTFQILLLWTCTLCQQKCYISNGIQPIFEIFASARRSWGWAFGWKASCAQVFCFCNGKVKTLLIDNIWYFATINMYTFSANILYLQRY